MEPVFRSLEIAVKSAVAATGTRVTYEGLGHIPATGGAVVPVTVRVAAPIPPSGSVDDLLAELRDTMTDQLYAVQRAYPHPADAYWVPNRLGGGAPTPAEAEVLDKAEWAERVRKSAEGR